MLLTYLWIILTLISVVLFSLYLYLSWHFKYWQSRQIAGPRPQLLVGNFPKSNAGKCNLVEELHEIYMQFREEHKFVGVFSARSPTLFILDPQLALEILTKHFSHFRDNVSSLWSSAKVEQLRFSSPFVSGGETWKERRTEFLPALSINRIRTFYSNMRATAGKMVQFIEQQSTNAAMDTQSLSRRYTAEVMADFIWGFEGQSFDSASGTDQHLYRAAEEMIAQTRKCVLYYMRTAAWPWLRKFRPIRFFSLKLEKYFRQLIKDTIELRRSSNLNAQRNDVVSHLLQLAQRKELGDMQMAGHTTTVLIDGFETAAVVISHCLMLLARNQRAQEKLRQEIKSAPSLDTYEALDALPYLEQCIQETLRIFPPLTILFKICTEPIQLPHTATRPLQLNKNDIVYISSYSFQHDATYFEHPEEFWPERFAAEQGGVRKYRDMGVFLPFGDGPRMCPGMKLGLMEAKIAVAEVVKNFVITPSDSTCVNNSLNPDAFLLIVKGKIDLNYRKILKSD